MTEPLISVGGGAACRQSVTYVFGITCNPCLQNGLLQSGGQGQSARTDETSAAAPCGLIFSTESGRAVKSTGTRIFSEQISRPTVTHRNPIRRLAADS